MGISGNVQMLSTTPFKPTCEMLAALPSQLPVHSSISAKQRLRGTAVLLLGAGGRRALKLEQPVEGVSAAAWASEILQTCRQAGRRASRQRAPLRHAALLCEGLYGVRWHERAH